MRIAYLLAAFVFFASPAAAQGRFYDAPRIDALGKPGTLVRSQAIEGAPLNAAAYRVLYRSTSFDG
ncbi:MAG TPA: lipase, partial [Methylovirgula sp.]